MPLQNHRAADTDDISTIMRRNVPIAGPDYSIETVAEALLQMRAGGVPVVDEKRRPIGIVTLADVMREWLAVGDQEEVEPRTVRLRDLARDAAEPGLHRMRKLRATVGDIMARLVLTLPLGTPIVEAAAAMTELAITCLVVVDARRAVVGLVTTSDVTSWASSRVDRGRGYA